MDFAFQNRVALVSPVSLFAVLKTVAFTWRQSSDEQVINEIISLGAELYKQIRHIGEKYATLGTHIDDVVEDYNKLLFNLDDRLLEPTRTLNQKSQYRLGIETIPAQKQVERARKKPVSQELTDGPDNPDK